LLSCKRTIRSSLCTLITTQDFKDQVKRPRSVCVYGI